MLFLFTILIVVFTLQNTEIVSIKLWFWVLKTPRALLIIASVAIGAFIGIIAPPLLKKRKKEEINSKEEESPDNTSLD